MTDREGTATRKNDVVICTDRLGAVVVLVPIEPAQPLPDRADHLETFLHTDRERAVMTPVGSGTARAAGAVAA